MNKRSLRPLKTFENIEEILDNIEEVEDLLTELEEEL